MEIKSVGPAYCGFCGSTELNSQNRCKTFRCLNMRPLSELSEKEMQEYRRVEDTSIAFRIGQQLFSR